MNSYLSQKFVLHNILGLSLREIDDNEQMWLQENMTPTSTKILSNQVLCRLCGDAPYSAGRHSYLSCKCGKVSVDGGMEYLRRVYDDDADYIDISIEWSLAEYQRVHDAINPLWRPLVEATWLPGGESLVIENPVIIKVRNQQKKTLDALVMEQNQSRDVIALLYIDLRSLDLGKIQIYRKAVDWAFDTRRNTLGLICALARTERDGDFYVTD